MYEPSLDQREGANATEAIIRRFFGVCLLLFGIGIAIWIIVSLVGLLSANSTPALVASLVPVADKPVKLGVPEGEFTLPREVFVPIGYLVVCFVYAISAGLAGMLINSGTSLLQPEVGKLLRRLVVLLERKAQK